MVNGSLTTLDDKSQAPSFPFCYLQLIMAESLECLQWQVGGPVTANLLGWPAISHPILIKIRSLNWIQSPTELSSSRLLGPPGAIQIPSSNAPFGCLSQAPICLQMAVLTLSSWSMARTVDANHGEGPIWLHGMPCLASEGLVCGSLHGPGGIIDTGSQG